MRIFLSATIFMFTAFGMGNTRQIQAAENGYDGIFDPYAQPNGRESSCCDSYVNDGNCDSGCFPPGGSCIQGWSATVDALFLNRDAADNLGGLGLVSRGGSTLLDNSGLDPSEEAGYRVSLNLQRSECVNLEAMYFATEWDTGRTFTGANNLNAVAGTLNYTLADQIGVRYDSDFDNLEINRWKRVSNNFSWMAGFRYVSLDENFRMSAQDSGFNSNYSIDTDNDLYGGQLGAKQQASFYANCINLSVLGKAGLYGNDANQRSLLQDVNGTINTRNFTNSAGATAFVGEINANATLWLSGALAAHLGYQLLWIDNVALAPEQFQQSAVTPNAALDNSGKVFMNGAYVGMGLHW